MHQSFAKIVKHKRYIAATVVCTGVLAFAAPTLAFATTSAELQAEADAALVQLNAMQETLDQAEDNYYVALQDQEAAQKAMDEAQANIDETNEQIADVQGKLSSRARSMYRSGASSIVDLLLGSTSFKEFTTNWDLLTSLNNNDSNMVEQTKELREQLEQEKAVYAEQEQIAAQKAEEAKQVKESAEATVSSIQAIYNSLSAEASALLQQERAAQEAIAQANAQQVLANAAIEANDWYSNINASYTADDNSGQYYTSYDASTGTTYVTEPSYNSSTGNSIVDRAYSWVGKAQYSWGACQEGAFDCSGFVSYCLSGAYNRLGSTSTFLDWSHVSEPQPGDVCVNDGHCGIYIGNGQMVHASDYGVGVVVGSVQDGMVFVRN